MRDQLGQTQALNHLLLREREERKSEIRLLREALGDAQQAEMLALAENIQLRQRPYQRAAQAPFTVIE